MKATPRVLVSLLLLLLVGCSAPPLTNAPPVNDRICCFGDSLVAGVGAPEGESYPAQLARLTEQPVAALGTSGDTTADALTRLASFDQQSFGIIIVTLGGNDILQRVHWDETRENLRQLFQKLQETGAVVVFTGVTGPLNPTRNRHYGNLCEEEGVLFIPDILDGILNNAELKADDVHPNAKGYRLIAERVTDALREAELLTTAETTP